MPLAHTFLMPFKWKKRKRVVILPKLQEGILCHSSTKAVQKRTLQQAGCVVWFGTKNEKGGGGGWIEFTAGFFLFFPEKVIGKLCGAWAKAARCPGIKKSISISKIVTTLGFRDLDPSFWPWDWPGCPWPAPVLTRQPKESLGTVEQEPHDRALGRRQDRSPWLHATELGWGWAFSRESFWETSKVYHR